MAIAHIAHATYQLDVALVSQSQGGNTSVLNVHIYAYADSGWSGNASGIGWSGTGGSGTSSFSGTSWEIANYNITVGHDSAGNYSGTITGHVNATGTATFGGPVDMAQPVSLPRIPKVPQAPSLTGSAQPGLKVNLAVGIPSGYDEGGSSVQYLWTEYSYNGGAFTGGMSGGWGARTYSNLLPGNYVFRARAHNAIGDGPNSATVAVTVLAGGYVWNGTAWVASQGVYVWNGTNWVICLGVYVWNGTTWTPAL